MSNSTTIKPESKNIEGDLVLSINQNNNNINISSNIPLSVTSDQEDMVNMEELNTSDNTFVPFSESEEEYSEYSQYESSSEELLTTETKKSRSSNLEELLVKCTREEDITKIIQNVDYIAAKIEENGDDALSTDTVYNKMEETIDIIDKVNNDCIVENIHKEYTASIQNECKLNECKKIKDLITDEAIKDLRTALKLSIKYDKLLKKLATKLARLYCKVCENLEVSVPTDILKYSNENVLLTSEESYESSAEESSNETVEVIKKRSLIFETDSGSSDSSNSSDDSSISISDDIDTTISTSSLSTASLEARANISSVTNVINNRKEVNVTNVNKPAVETTVISTNTNASACACTPTSTTNENTESLFGYTTFVILFIVIALLLINYFFSDTASEETTTSLPVLSIDSSNVAVGGYSNSLWNIYKN